MFKLTKTFTVVAIAVAALAISSAASAVTCTVDVATGDGAGTLVQKAGDCSCTEINFTEDISTVTLPESLSVGCGSAVAIDGGDRVIIELVEGKPLTSPVINVSSELVTLRNLTVRHPGGLAVVITGGSNTVDSCVFESSKTAIKVSGGNFNYLTQNSFNGITETAIALVAGGNQDLSFATDLDAIMTDADTWQLKGYVDDSVTAVEIYEAYDSDVPQGERYVATTSAFGTDAGGTYFTANLSIDDNYAGLGYTVLVFDGDSNTSEFSDVILPLVDSDFFGEAFAACDIDWFTDEANGGWAGDYDSDGTSNGDEDANKNCVVDDGERNPDDPNDAVTAEGSEGTTLTPGEGPPQVEGQGAGEGGEGEGTGEDGEVIGSETGTPEGELTEEAAEGSGGGCSLASGYDVIDRTDVMMIALALVAVLGIRFAASRKTTTCHH